MPVSPGQLVLSRRSSSQISSPAVSTPLSRASSPATVFSASLPSRRSPAPSSTSPGGSQIQQLLRPAAPTLSHDAQLVANRELEKAQAQLEGILSEQRAMSEQSKRWHAALSESPKSFSQQVQASAARLSQLDIEHAETEALLQHRATLAVYTERSLAAQASTSSAQQEFERARQAAREVRRGADPCPHTHTFSHAATHIPTRCVWQAAALEAAALEAWARAKGEEASVKGEMVSTETKWKNRATAEAGSLTLATATLPIGLMQ